MAEEMREVTGAAELRGVAEQYPNVRKVTVDAANGMAYVFLGCSMQAQTVTGKAFDALMKALPEKTADETNDETADETNDETADETNDETADETPVGPGKAKKR